jgi:hypothetical protein
MATALKGPSSVPTCIAKVNAATRDSVRVRRDGALARARIAG